MQLANLLGETLDVEEQDVWENERTPTPVRRFGVRLHSMGLSVRETQAVLAWLGVDRSHGAIWQWTHRLADSGSDPPTVQPSRVATDETAVQIGEEWCWLYAAIDLESLLLLDVGLFSRRGTDPAALTRAKLPLANQNVLRSDDGVFAPPHRETRCRRDRVSRRCWRLSDCPLTSRFERSA